MIGYLDLPSGLSGDMFLSCLVDGGWPVEQLRGTLAGLRIPGEEYSVEAAPVMRGPFRATCVSVKVVKTSHHRHLGQIRAIIGESSLPEAVKSRALAVFHRLAAAEAAVHGIEIEKVHFHEVGAVDAIVDIVGVCAGLAVLGIDRLYASPVPLGHGWIDTAHGRMPLPAPATLQILSAVGAPTRPAPGEGELLTPTGAAMLAELATFTQPQMTLSRIAVGAGQKSFAWPNIARLWLGEETAGGPIVQIETNIDDMNPQLCPVVVERLLAAGARDAWITPVQMKKGRPGVVISALADAAAEQAVVDVLLRETTTLGVRVHPVSRHEAERQIVTVRTPYGDVRVKLKKLDGNVVGATPEFEDCRKLAEERGVPVKQVIEIVGSASADALGRATTADVR